MKLSDRVHSISYLKAHAADILRDVRETRQPVVITQNGEAKVVVQDVEAWDELMESLAMLKLLAQSNKSVADGNVRSLEDGIASIRARTGE